MDTLQWASKVRSREEGGERREKCVDGALERACKVGRRDEGEGCNSSFPVICIGLGKENARVT